MSAVGSKGDGDHLVVHDPRHLAALGHPGNVIQRPGHGYIGGDIGKRGIAAVYGGRSPIEISISTAAVQRNFP